MDWVTIIIILILVLWLPTRIKILKDHERYAVTILGRFKKINGPGMLFKWYGAESQWTKLSIGDIGRYLGDNIAEFQSVSVPVRFDNKPSHGVKIERFDDGEIWVVPSKVMSVRCEKCGHYNEISA